MKTKHLFLILTAMMLFGTAMPAEAQKKKKRTTTTTTRIDRTTTSTPRAQVNNKCVIYHIEGGITSAFAGNDFIYYVEKNENNAVMRIDKKTGDVSTYIPGIKGIYEGARPYIKGVYACGDKILLRLSGDKFATYDFDMKLVVYNGQDVKTSPVILKNGIINVLHCGNDYFVTKKEDSHYDVTVWYWDPQTMKTTKKFLGSEAFNDCVWAPDGGSWRVAREDRLKIYRFNPKENKSYYWTLKNQSYVKDYFSRNSSGLEITKLTPKGDTLYIACGRRVYCINMISPDGISEYAKVPANMNYTFKNVWVDPQGNMLSEGGNSYEYRDNNTLYWDVNSFDSPTPLGNQLKTGFDKFGYTEIWLGLDKRIYSDANGNFIILNPDGEISIYNPKGIVGFTNAVGKIIKK